MTGQHFAQCGGTAILALCLVTGLRGQAPFSSHSDLVVLHVAVTDRDSHHVPGLTRDAFTILEDGMPQPIVAFNSDDAPATIGLLLDDSTSMQRLRTHVATAAAAFVATSNPADEIFALTFNEHVRAVLPPSVPFTSDAEDLRQRLQFKVMTRGRTALYDAVNSGISHLETGTHPRKALVIVSDGGDNASVHTLAEMRMALWESNTTVYAVALTGAADSDADPGLLKRLAEASGGLCFAPRGPAGIAEALSAIARDIRSVYTIGYAVPAGLPGLRHVRISVHGANGRLKARTRREYLVK